jgi:large subunit ribosomal protein L14
MVLPSTVILTMDNSGARRVKCIRIYNKPGISYGVTGDLLLVLVTRLRNRGLIRVIRGEILTCLLTRISTQVFRKKRGYYFKFDTNTVIVLTKKGTPTGTRLFGPCAKELEKKGFGRISSLCAEAL